MKPYHSPFELTPGEIKLVMMLLELGEATVDELVERSIQKQARITMCLNLRMLSNKGLIKFRRTGVKYRYWSAITREDFVRAQLRIMEEHIFTGDSLALKETIDEYFSLGDTCQDVPFL